MPTSHIQVPERVPNLVESSNAIYLIHSDKVWDVTYMFRNEGEGVRE